MNWTRIDRIDPIGNGDDVKTKSPRRRGKVLSSETKCPIFVFHSRWQIHRGTKLVTIQCLKIFYRNDRFLLAIRFVMRKNPVIRGKELISQETLFFISGEQFQCPMIEEQFFGSSTLSPAPFTGINAIGQITFQIQRHVHPTHRAFGFGRTIEWCSSSHADPEDNLSVSHLRRKIERRSAQSFQISMTPPIRQKDFGEIGWTDAQMNASVEID